ncbi:MAG: hypothetical protein K2I03_06060, partial [Lachnospiraceae bacterium]|nr:hypothetical protein [Lachnospiraceae bacterium]
MVNEKNKRKIRYNGTVYYWYVRVENSTHKVHIISEDKKVNLEYPFFDSELPITPQIIRNHLKEYNESLS